MGYECPVCSIPQADASHLANHLAFRALVHSDDHERYLDETVPEWSSLGEDELGAALEATVDETEFPQVFEDTTPAHDHGSHAPPMDGAVDPHGAGTLDAEARRILEEARAMTEESEQSD